MPQLLGKDAEGFIWAARELRALGYREINFNLGCPSGTVTAKGKGAGFDPSRRAGGVSGPYFSALEGPISIKTRLGYAAPEEFSALLELYNRYPIAELIIHPRVRQDFYRCAVRMEAFEAALRHSRNPVGYNGDLMSLSDCAAVEARFPSVTSLMLGRGLIADPALLRPEKRTRERLQAFDEALYEGYRTMFGNDRNAIMRMKEVWYYHIHLFEGGEKLAKRLRRTTDRAEYCAAVQEIYRTLPLREPPSRVGRAETERRPAAISRRASFNIREAALRAGETW